MGMLPLANDVDVAVMAETVARAAVKFETVSPGIRQQVDRLRPTPAFETLQVRLVPAVTKATVRRLQAEGVSTPALLGFLHIGALLAVPHFNDALYDLDERFLIHRRSGATPDPRAWVPLAVALDYAGAQVPTLDTAHLRCLCAFMSRMPR